MELSPEGEYLYRIVAKGKGKAEFASDWYKFDTSFFYGLADKPRRPSPFADDATMRRVQLAANTDCCRERYSAGLRAGAR